MVTLRLETIKSKDDFLRVKQGKKFITAEFILQAKKRLHISPINDKAVRIGFIATKKIGGAVIRNRAKRRFRALSRSILPTYGQAQWDYVILIRKAATFEKLSFLELEKLYIKAITFFYQSEFKPSQNFKSVFTRFFFIIF